MSKLLPCPSLICSGGRVLRKGPDSGGWHWIECDACLFSSALFREAEEAEEHWNTRAEPTEAVIDDMVAAYVTRSRKDSPRKIVKRIYKAMITSMGEEL